MRSTTQVARLSPSSSAEPPVYVEGDADIVEVQRLMARNHIRSLPVVHGVVVVGIIDLLELAMMDEDLPGLDLTDRSQPSKASPPPSTYLPATHNVVVG
ncbi:MAG: CBS domain-containing protein [Actinomycetota bacterium]